jgi:hypothetical protein
MGIDVSTIKKAQNGLPVGWDLIKWAYSKAETADDPHDKTEVAPDIVFSETVSATPHLTQRGRSFPCRHFNTKGTFFSVSSLNSAR